MTLRKPAIGVVRILLLQVAATERLLHTLDRWLGWLN